MIIVSDGTRDLSTNYWDNADNAQRANMFEDFRELQKLAMADFGAEITVNWKDFSVSEGATDEKFHKHPHPHMLVGTIQNLPILDSSDTIDDKVKIILIKSAYSLDKRLLNHNSYVDLEKSRNPDFSHDSTANVGYSERRVLAYRELGRQTVRNAKTKKILTDTVNEVRTRYTK